MDIHIKKDEKTVEWNIGEKIITIPNENLLYAFKHSESGFTTYDAEGKRIFSYKYLENKKDAGNFKRSR